MKKSEKDKKAKFNKDSFKILNENRSLANFDNSVNKTQKESNFRDYPSTTDLKDILEKQDINSKVETFINDTIELLTTNTLAYGKEEKEKYELIDKSELQQLKDINNQLKDKEDQLIEKYNTLAAQQNIVSSELTNLIKKKQQETSSKDKIESDYNRVVKENEQIYITNEKLKHDINGMIIKKDNLFRALIFLKKYFDKPIPKDLEPIYQRYCNQFEAGSHLINKKDQVSVLQNKLNELKTKIASISSK